MALVPVACLPSSLCAFCWQPSVVSTLHTRFRFFPPASSLWVSGFRLGSYAFMKGQYNSVA